MCAHFERWISSTEWYLCRRMLCALYSVFAGVSVWMCRECLELLTNSERTNITRRDSHTKPISIHDPQRICRAKSRRENAEHTDMNTQWRLYRVDADSSGCVGCSTTQVTVDQWIVTNQSKSTMPKIGKLSQDSLLCGCIYMHISICRIKKNK